MNKNFLYGIVAVVAVVTVGAYLSETGIRITRVSTDSSSQMTEGRQPGDQRVRDQATGTSGAVKSRNARQSAGAKGGSGAMGGGRAAAGSVTDRFGEKGGPQMAKVDGAKPVPVLRNGAPAGELVGQRMAGELGEVAVNYRRNVRQGWAVSDALKLVGINAAKKATFVDRSGKSTTIEWGVLSDVNPLYILTYNQGGQLMLLAGEKTEDSAQAEKGRRSRRSNQKPTGEAPAESMHDIVRIEVS